MHHLISSTTAGTAAAACFRDGRGLGPSLACLIRLSTTVVQLRLPADRREKKTNFREGRLHVCKFSRLRQFGQLMEMRDGLSRRKDESLVTDEFDGVRNDQF